MKENKALESLKLQLEMFFENAQSQTIKKEINKSDYYFNKSLFELEKHISDLKKQYNVNQSLNTTIISNSILASFTNGKPHYRAHDYCLSFLMYLTTIEDHDAEQLLELMHLYIDDIKEKLTYEDIIKTNTGVTRCFTNLRFALNTNRSYGLVFNKISIDNKGKRTIMPTAVGYLIALHHIADNKNHITILPVYGNSQYNALPALYSTFSFMKSNIELFLVNLIKQFNSLSGMNEALRHILTDYYTYILKHIHVTNDGFKVDEKDLEESMKNYHQILANQISTANLLKNIFQKEINK